MSIVYRGTEGGAVRVSEDDDPRIVSNTLGPDLLDLSFERALNQRVVFTTPPPDVLSAFAASQARIVRFVDIYESNNVTPWRRNVGIEAGNISVDANRDERRVIDIEIAGEDGAIQYGPGEFWYDKIIKPYRGLTIDGIDYVTCLGEFLIDRISAPSFPNKFVVSGRDFTKRLLLDKYSQATTFVAGASLENVIKTIALNAGFDVTKINVPATGKVLSDNFTFEADTPRWEAMRTMASAYGFEVFFDNFGNLRMRPFVDPLTAPVAHIFKTGQEGNLVRYEKSANDSQLFNEVIVRGTGQTNGLVFGRAENTEPSSPTSIAKIGRRTLPYPSQVVPTNQEAEEIAKRILKVAALEQYDVVMESIVAPWLEAGDAVEFIEPNASEASPKRFLLSSFDIPLALGAMTANAKRIHIVGGAT